MSNKNDKPVSACINLFSCDQTKINKKCIHVWLLQINVLKKKPNLSIQSYVCSLWARSSLRGSTRYYVQ